MSSRTILRRLLRIVDRHITTHNGNQKWREYILEQFHKANEMQQKQAEQKLACAVEYADLVMSVHAHKVCTSREGMWGMDAV